MAYELHEMDCRLAMSMLMEPDSMDSIVCDPPYGLSKEPDMAEVLRHWLAGDDYAHGGSGFMGKTWDSFVPGPSVWREAYRVLKPGGYLIAFFGTRTYDLGTLAIRLAGFEIRDQLAWVFGSGFPKSLNIAKAIASGTGRPEDIRRMEMGSQYEPSGRGRVNYDHGAASAMGGREAAQVEGKWQGWGTALKPAYEPIVLARKPLSERTVAANVLTHGTGGLNVDGCRVGTESIQTRIAVRENAGGQAFGIGGQGSATNGTVHAGRWPANLCHDGSDEVLAGFPASSTTGKRKEPNRVQQVTGATNFTRGNDAPEYTDSGSAARFYYCAKASKTDRNAGCDTLPVKAGGMTSNTSGQHMTRRDAGYDPAPVANHHPTVKPTDLMRWLCRLVTPPGGTVFDPFAGSGSTGKAALLEGFEFVGCEMTPEYATIAHARLTHAASVRGG